MLTFGRSLIFSKITVEYTTNRPGCIPVKLFALLLEQREGKREKKWFAAASNFVLPARVSLSVPCQHFWPSLCQLHLRYHVLFLQRRHTKTFSHIGLCVCVCVCVGGGLARCRSQAGSKAMSGRARVVLQKPAAPHCLCLSPRPDSSQKYEASRDLCPGEKSTERHTSHTTFCLCSLSLLLFLSLSP